MGTTFTIILTIALAAILIALIVMILSIRSIAGAQDKNSIKRLIDQIKEMKIEQDVERRTRSEQAQQDHMELLQLFNQSQDQTRNALSAMSDSMNMTLQETLQKTSKTMHDISAQQTEALQNLDKSMTETLSANLERIRKTNEEKLDEIQGSVNKKLDQSLNERLDKSFGTIADQLAELYKSLGELGQMSSGISDLNRALSNVKIRGTWGEAQLRDIIMNTMTPAQYEENIVIKESTNDPVEFAIKIPSKENPGEFVLLPIDSKFPMDVFNAVIDASESGNKPQIQEAINLLSIRIKGEARKIRDKYISVPRTTNFAVMYLPTESLFAEVLRINGLAETCQNEYGIILAGPTTITALLNSLRVGFQNLTLSKKTDEVRRLLSAIKMQYDKLSELITATQKKIDAASASNIKLRDRTEIIRKRMNKIAGDMTEEESDVLLGMNDADFDMIQLEEDMESIEQ